MIIPNEHTGAGVDEPTIVKTDAKYISRSFQGRDSLRKKPAPPDQNIRLAESEILTKDINATPAEKIFFSGDRLTVLGSQYYSYGYDEPVPLMDKIRGKALIRKASKSTAGPKAKIVVL